LKITNYGVRKYDEDIGRFTSVDPLWSKYIGWTPYHYCGNDPINASDGNGLDYQITADATDGNNMININVPINLCGSAASDYMVSSMQAALNAAWNNNGAGWNVNYDGQNFI
jgi:uncharacterized protein RhaS with RHS repeats